MAAMTSDVTRHLGFAQKFFKALDGAGFTPTEINLLAEDPALLEQIRALLHANQNGNKKTGGSKHIATTISDFAVEVSVHNGHIVRELMENGFVHARRPSFNQLTEHLSYGFGSAEEIESRRIYSLKTLPIENTGGAWKKEVVDMARALNTTPEELFPGPLKHRLPGKTWMILDGKIGESISLKIMD